MAAHLSCKLCLFHHYYYCIFNCCKARRTSRTFLPAPARTATPKQALRCSIIRSRRRLALLFKRCSYLCEILSQQQLALRPSC